jgi:hypothetical protein
MTIDIFAVFEDFNEPRDEPPPPPPSSSIEDMPLTPSDVQSEAWTAGYLTRSAERSAESSDQKLAAKLLTSIYELDAKASDAGEAASLAVAELLVNTVIASTSDAWAARLLERVRLVAVRIRPALTMGVEFLLTDELGDVHCFHDVTEVSRLLDDGGAVKYVSIQWQRGEATMSQVELLQDIREAILPLSAGLVTEQHRKSHA